MKLIKYVLSLLFLFSVHSLEAQVQHTCDFGPQTEKLKNENPLYEQEVLQMQQNIQQDLQQYRNQQTGSRAVRTISVVVHVVYNTAAENVPQSEINDMIDLLNVNYRKQNSNLGVPRNAYVSLAADAEIEFCLDQTIRVNTSKTCFDYNTESSDMKSSFTGGSDAINPSQFMNIWIINICNTQQNGIGGYTVFPSQQVVGSSVDGIVLEYTIGFSQGQSVALTHEVGHYFGLQHTWGSDANPSCSTDDGFNDTPNSDGPNYVCQQTNSCNTPAPGDMYENFMDYSNCQNMFTIEQAAYMNLVLDQLRSGLLSSTGCSNNTSAPVADFSSNKQYICVGQTVDFTDNTNGNVTSWAWAFQGGTPSSSIQQNPSVTYNTPGTYSVTLTATGPNGSDTETKVAFITVAASQNLPLLEGFQSTTFPPTDWELVNFDNGDTWQRTTTAGGYGLSSASAYVDNYNYNAAGNQDVLFTPNYDFSAVNNAYLKYDYAYAYYGVSQYSDTLIVAFTDDCGETYYALKSFGGSSLGTTTNNTSAFVPGSGDWDTDSLDISFLAGSPNVQFAFINVNGYGNNLYLDNINIDQTILNAPPVADFSASATTVPVGSQVNFTDLSSNAPTSWSWTFSGGTPGNSSQQNPTITYNTLGTYAVSLTAGNSFGNDTETKTAYINVVNSTSTVCDTMQNFNDTDTITVYRALQGGYVSGHNVYGDLAKADFFQANAGDELHQVSYYFGVGKQGSGTASIQAKIWDADGAAGAPNTELASINIALSSIVAAANNNLITWQFTTPLALNGNFYAGIEFTYANGDTVALMTNLNGNTNPGTAWEKTSGGNWISYASSWSLNMAHIILPVVCEPAPATPPVADFSANITSACMGTSIQFTDQSTNTPISWDWTFQGGTPSSSSQQNPLVSYSNSGTFEVSLTATNADGSDTKTVTGYITIHNSPSISGSTSNPSCNGSADGSISLNVSNGTSPYNYSWSNGGITQNVSGLGAGNYSVTVSDNNGCTNNASFNLNQPTPIQINGNIIDADCNQSNGSIVASASGGAGSYSYSWSGGITGPTRNNLAAGNYTVTATDANNCSNSRTFSINNSSAPLINILKTDVSCAGAENGAINAIVNAGTTPYSFTWSNGESDSLITDLSGGNFELTVTDANNCIATTNVSIYEPDTLVAVVTGNKPNCGNNNGSLTVNPQGGTPPYFFTWNNGSSSSTRNNLAAGNYRLTLTDSKGCFDIVNYNLNAFNAPSLTFNITDVTCNGTGGSITTNVSGGVGPYTYRWSNGLTTPGLNNLNPGTYILTVTDNSGCSVIQLATVNSAGPVIDYTKTDILTCYGDNSGSISLQMSNGTPPYTYIWSNALGGSSNINGLYAGTYSVTVLDDGNCQISETITILQPDSFGVALYTTDTDAGLNNGEAYLEVDGGTPPYSYNWSNGDNDSTNTNLSSGNYSVTVRDANGCSNIINFSIGIANSIESIGNAISWELYPNPARDVLFIKADQLSDSSIDIRVFSAIGKEIRTEIETGTKGEYRISLDSFSQGLYLLELRFKGQRWVKRFVVTK